MFFQHDVSLGCALAIAGWFIAVLLTVANLLWPNNGIGPLAVLFMAGAGTLQVCSAIHRLDRREFSAFELGRDSVRPMR